jgi:hypothetical protein
MSLTIKRVDELAALPSAIFWSEEECRALLQFARLDVAWNECVEEMPRGWAMVGIEHLLGRWRATAKSGAKAIYGDGRTRTEALLALRDKMKAGLNR